MLHVTTMDRTYKNIDNLAFPFITYTSCRRLIVSWGHILEHWVFQALLQCSTLLIAIRDSVTLTSFCNKITSRAYPFTQHSRGNPTHDGWLAQYEAGAADPFIWLADHNNSDHKPVLPLNTSYAHHHKSQVTNKYITNVYRYYNNTSHWFSSLFLFLPIWWDWPVDDKLY